MLFLLTLFANAEPVDPFTEPDEAERFRREFQVVTVAAQYAQTVEHAPSIVSLFTAQDIDALGVRTLSELLRTLPGIYTGTSKESRDLAWFRGTISSDNNKILLLVDGVPWYDGVYHHAWLDHYLPLNHIKQIEVIKGPGSAIYGSNAFAGVINIVTYKAEEIKKPKVEIQMGTYGRIGIEVLAGAADLNGVSIRGYGRYMEEDGDGLSITPKGGENLLGTAPRRAVNGGLDLQYKKWTARLDFVDYRHQYFINEKDSFSSILSESASDFNLYYRNFYSYVSFTQSIFDLGDVRVFGFWQRHHNDSIYGWEEPVSLEREFRMNVAKEPYNGLGISKTLSLNSSETLVQAVKHTDSYGVGTEGSVQIGVDHITTFGTGARWIDVAQIEDRIFRNDNGYPESPSPYAAPAGSQISSLYGYLQHTWMLNWWLEITGGVRLDSYNHSGTFASPRAGILMVPSNKTMLKLLYGRAFRAPTARESLVVVEPDENDFMPYTNGNLDLRAESIDTFEMEYRWNYSQLLSFRNSLFFSTQSDQIDKAVPQTPHPELGSQYYFNLGQSQSMGGEAQILWKKGLSIVDLNYSYVRAVDLNTDRIQYGFPPHMGHIQLGKELSEGFGVRLRWDIYSARPRAQWTPNSQLPDGEPFSLGHFSALYQAPASERPLTIKMSVNNILNTDYRYLLYLDDTDLLKNGSPKYPEDLQGEGRVVYIAFEREL